MTKHTINAINFFIPSNLQNLVLLKLSEENMPII